jgi:DNA-binding MarR family transcriptional regulator
VAPSDSSRTAEPTDDIAALAARLRLSTTRLARRLRAEADIGLSPSLLSALAMVHVHGPLTLGHLAEMEGVSPPTVTKVVGRLEQERLVERVIDPTDRRVCRVRTTDAGDALLAASRSRKNAWLAAGLAGLDDTRRHELQSAVGVIEELLEGPPEGEAQ